MVETGFTRLPVVILRTKRLLGMISLEDLLRARGRNLEEERSRERVLRLGCRRPASATEKVSIDEP